MESQPAREVIKASPARPLMIVFLMYKRGSTLFISIYLVDVFRYNLLKETFISFKFLFSHIKEEKPMKLMKPLVVINFKTYHAGKAALKLANIVEKEDKNIIIGAQSADIYNIAKNTKLKVFALHVDPIEPGRHTGFIVPKSVKENGAVGTFLNHSEHPLSFDTLKKTIKMCKKVKLKTYVFAKSPQEAKNIEKLGPDLIIYEPKELVGGMVSVAQAKPDVIQKVRKVLKKQTKFLVGAGIHTKEDIDVSMKLGAHGIAFSSAFTTAKHPQKVLRRLLK